MKANRRNASRVMITLHSLNLKSATYPCADRLIFRDFKNDLTMLDVNANRLKATGNFTTTKGKGYLCQLQFQVIIKFFSNLKITLYNSRLWYRRETFPCRLECSLRHPACWPPSISMLCVPLRSISNHLPQCLAVATISFIRFTFAAQPGPM